MRTFFKNIALCVTFVMFIASPTVAFGQQFFSYSFDGLSLSPWPAEWQVTPSGNGALREDHSLSVNGERTAGVLGISPGINLQVTAVNTSKSYNLVSGASQPWTIRQTWAPWTGGGSDTTNWGLNELFKIGFVDSTSQTQLEDAFSGHNSFYLSALEMDATLAPSNDYNTQLRLAYRNELGAEIVSFDTLSFDQLDRVTQGVNNRYVYDISQTFTPTATSGILDIDINIDQYMIQITNSGGVFSYSDSFVGNFASYSLKNVDSGMTSASLATLYPALGIHIRDFSSISVSGANFDAIPEPASGLLGLLGSLILLSYRHRPSAGA